MTCRRVEHVSCLEPERWRALVDQAQAVVTHAGPASILMFRPWERCPLLFRALQRGRACGRSSGVVRTDAAPRHPYGVQSLRVVEHLDAPPPPCASPDLSALQTEAVRVVERTTRDLVQRSHLGWFRRVLRACCWP